MKKGPIIAIASAAVLTALMVIAPRTPKTVAAAEVSEEAHDHEHDAEMSDLDAKVARAVEIIQGGEQPPMAGVALLREVIEEDPEHIGALMWLGEFSIMSGQLDKAEERYLKVLSIQPNNYVALERLLLVYGENGNTEGEILAIQEFLDKNESTPNREVLEARLAQIQE